MKRIILLMIWFSVFSAKGQLEKMFGREADYQHFNGVVLVRQGDSTFFEKCYGTTDSSRPVKLNTTFDIGSITKQFTAAGILHLVQEGKLKLRDPINSHLGGYASSKWDKVTLHQLLTHTSGVPSVYQTDQGLDIFFPEFSSISLDDLIGKFKDAKLLFSPGEEFSYSNSGYILLAAIIQQVSDMSYYQFMEQMFQKYGLFETSFAANDVSAQPFYGYRNDLLKKAPVNHRSWFIGAGGVYSTVEDLSKWIQTINSKDFLSPDLRSEFLKSHTNTGYGYGWQFRDDIIQHDGGNAGFMSYLSFNPEKKTHIIILTNRSFENIKFYGKSANYINELVSKTWKMLDGERVEVLPKIVEDQGLTELYTFANGQAISTSRNDTALLINTPSTYPTRILFNTPFPGDGEREKIMIDIAENLEKRKYWSLSKHCDGEMKFVVYSGLMSVGMRMMKKQTGGAGEFIPYYVEESHGLIRMKGSEGILDLIVYFDNDGRIQGIFENGFSESDREVSMIAYPIGQSLYYIDGLPYGEESATLKVTDEKLIIYQMNRSITARKQ